MLQIGFATKFYTLWNVYKNVIDNGYYKYIEVRCEFVKNISIDEDKAFAQYPDVPFNDALRGKERSFIASRKKIYTDVETLRFGRSEGHKADKEDTSYLIWYYANCGDDADHLAYIKSILQSRGCPFYEERPFYCQSDLDKYLAEEAREKERKARAKAYKDYLTDTIERAKRGEELYFNSSRNDTGHTESQYDSGIKIEFSFENYKTCYYNGYAYYLPIDGKGKAKRIKDKKVVVTKYEVFINSENSISVYIQDFRVENQEEQA